MKHPANLATGQPFMVPNYNNPREGGPGERKYSSNL